MGSESTAPDETSAPVEAPETPAETAEPTEPSSPEPEAE
jgi:hypothetical protein